MTSKVKRIQVIFSKEQYDLIKELQGEMGVSDSEIVRSIVLAWLAEKSLISTTLKSKIAKWKK